MRELPFATFKIRVGDNEPLGGGCAIGGEWREITTDEIFANKKCILFALPGAYTPTCSSTHLPGYEDEYDTLLNYVDEIYCVSVNDTFVMNAWAKDLKIEKVKLLPDGTGIFTKGMDMLVNKDHLGFGMRSWRYSAHIINGEIKRMFVEPGMNNAGDEKDPFTVSDANTMLKYIKNI